MNQPALDTPPRLIQRQGTRLLRDGRPLREISFNKFDLLWQYLHYHDEPNGRPAALDGMDWLRDHGFTIIRIVACPFATSEFNATFFDPDPKAQAVKREHYFQRFDELLADCEARGLQIVASLAWNTPIIGELGAHAIEEGLINPRAEGRLKVEDYIREVVTRYRQRVGIAFWEIDNEWNLLADLRLPDKPDWRYNANQLGAFYRDIAVLIKHLDPHHLLTTGDSSPRPAAWHLYRSSVLQTPERDDTLDTEDELLAYLRMVNPDPIDVISIHYYDEAMFALGRELGNVENIALYKRLADRLEKPLFIGEVGPHHGFNEARYTDPRNLDLTHRVIDQSIASDVPLTLFWAFRDDREPLTQGITGYNLFPGHTDDALALIAAGQKRISNS